MIVRTVQQNVTANSNFKSRDSCGLSDNAITYHVSYVDIFQRPCM